MSAKTKSEWPKVVKVGNSSVKIYERNGSGFKICFYDTDGKRKFLSAPDAASAMTLATDKATKLSSHGAQVAGMSAQDASGFIRCQEILKPHGIELGDGVAHLDRWLRVHRTLAGIDAALTAAVSNAATLSQIIERAVPVAVKEYLTELVNDGLSELHIRGFRGRLTNLEQSFPCNVSTVTTDALQAWLDKCNGGNTNYDNNRRALSAFFSWCYTKRYHFENPAFTPKRNARIAGKLYLKVRDVGVSTKNVFKPDELKVLLAAAKGLDAALLQANPKAQPFHVPLIAICSLAGLRTSEFARLRWRDMDFDNGRLIIGEDDGKTTGSYRSLYLTKSLCAGLGQFRYCKGFIWPSQRETFAKTFQAVCDMQSKIAQMGNMKWRQNAPRHSYISYRVALRHPVAEIASDAGNSPAMIHKHYKSLRFADGTFINERDAAAWFDTEVPIVKNP